MIAMGHTIGEEHYLTVPEVAEHLGMNEATVRKWIRRKKIPAKRLGWQYFVREQDVEALPKPKG